MAIATLKLVYKPTVHLRPTPFQCIRKLVPKSVAAVDPDQCTASIPEQQDKPGLELSSLLLVFCDVFEMLNWCCVLFFLRWCDSEMLIFFWFIKIEEENKKAPAWKKLDSKELGLQNSMIARPTKKVLNVLKKKGKCCSLSTYYVCKFRDRIA